MSARSELPFADPPSSRVVYWYADCQLCYFSHRLPPLLRFHPLHFHPLPAECAHAIGNGFYRPWSCRRERSGGSDYDRKYGYEPDYPCRRDEFFS